MSKGLLMSNTLRNSFEMSLDKAFLQIALQKTQKQ